MRKVVLIAAFNLFILIVHAQSSETTKGQQEKIEFNEYTVTAIQQPDGTYGYTIAKGPQFIKYQGMNPFNFSAKGLKRKEDAFQVAKWELKNLKKGERLSTILSQPIPKKVGQELNIDMSF